MKTLYVSLLLALVCSGPALAATKSVTLSVPSMTCAACPITVKKALEKVDGVIEVNVTWEPREAVVTYDEAKVTVRDLIEATANSGYPSSEKS